MTVGELVAAAFERHAVTDANAWCLSPRTPMGELGRVGCSSASGDGAAGAGLPAGLGVVETLAAERVDVPGR
jgi:hypothetical protein